MSTYAIKCPNCGGSLDILSGARQIKTITCKYCGSVLDIANEYKLLSKFSKVKIPKSPFEIGMVGKIKEVEFRIIGLVAYSCEKGITTGKDTWIDYMLYSPTHGYAWLSYEDGNTIFSRRTRLLPDKKMPNLELYDQFEFDNETYEYYDKYKAYITFVQGELTWVAKKNDVVNIYEAISPPFGLSYDRSKRESEYNISEYINPEDVYKSFNIPTEENGLRIMKQAGFHPLKPYPEIYEAYLFSSIIFSIISLVIVVVLSFNDMYRIIYFGWLLAFFASNFVISFMQYNSYLEELWEHLPQEYYDD